MSWLAPQPAMKAAASTIAHILHFAVPFEHIHDSIAWGRAEGTGLTPLCKLVGSEDGHGMSYDVHDLRKERWTEDSPF